MLKNTSRSGGTCRRSRSRAKRQGLPAAASSRSSKQHRAPSGRSAVHPALDALCAIKNATTRRSSSFFVVRLVRQRVVEAKVRSVAATVHELAAAAAAAAALATALAAALFCSNQLSCLQQRLLAAALDCRSACTAAAHLLAAAAVAAARLQKQ